MQQNKFEFARSRGVVWVCDLAGSSSHLNNNDTVAALEEFIPRLHWTASAVVEAAGGRFIKWTGDGFLAWFETPLHHDLGRVATAVFEAAWHLTVLVNVTQLCITSPKKYKIRHGISHEQDALITTISTPSGAVFTDLIGRSVVLAFRLSGSSADFPNIATEQSLVEACGDRWRKHIAFNEWVVSEEESLKFFKGEKWGTSHLYQSKSKKPERVSMEDVLQQSRATINAAENQITTASEATTFGTQFLEKMLSGPSWCKEVVKEYTRYLREDLLGSLKQIVLIFQELSDISDTSNPTY